AHREPAARSHEEGAMSGARDREPRPLDSQANACLVEHERHDPPEEAESKRVGAGTIRLLTPTQCVMDRLAAYFHWNDLPRSTRLSWSP
ncbi:MAG TPA: hypothetical protein VMH39_00720, partial [Gemmatimonadaceae bacterium]|nr:hypothetical protein [Gemmatimonadaceae bacterium]